MTQSESCVVKQTIDRALLWKSGPPLLGRLDMELTERCNNNCAHCYINLPADDVEAGKKELTLEEIRRILEEAVSLGYMVVRFTGGEPLLRKDFEQIYVFARGRGLKVSIFTNAAFIDTHMAELFADIPPLEKIEITVYGVREETYEAATRARGSFEPAWRGINLLLEKRIPFIVKSVLLPSNKRETTEFEKWAATIPWMRRPPSYSMFFDLRCRGDRQKNEMIKRLRVAPEEALRILARDNDWYLQEMRKFCAKFTRPHGDELFSCGAGHGGCVDAYGNFQLCMLLRHPDTVYNIRNGSLRDALENFFPRIRKMRAKNHRYLSRCAKCFLKGLCEQCPGKSWMEHGTIDTPSEYLCEVAHAQARYIGLIKEGEGAWEVTDWEERIKKFCEREEIDHGNKNWC